MKKLPKGAPKGVEIVGPMKPGYEKILTPEALAFVAKLVRKHGPTRSELLSMILGAFFGPVSELQRSMNGLLSEMRGLIEALAEKKGGAGE